MKIALAQTLPVAGDIARNLETHQRFIEQAAAHQAEAIFFPELSITGYEPTLAATLAIDPNDTLLDQLQELSNIHQLTIGAGMPTKSEAGIHISLLLFQPHQPRQVYSKQWLHVDEEPYFVPGSQPLLLPLKELVIAPAICYESLQPEHAQQAADSGAQLYLASVTKPAGGLAKAVQHYPAIAQKHQMTILMVNSVGPSDNFISVGQSGVWNAEGQWVVHLNDSEEGLVLWDSKHHSVQLLYL